MGPITKSQAKDEYTDEEINELAEWLEDLTLKQAFFLKDTYEAHLRLQANEHQGKGNAYVQ